MRLRTLLVFASTALSAAAQDVTTGQKAFIVQQGAFDPSQTSPISSPSAQLTLEGTRENAIAKARLGVQVKDFTLEAKLSGPIGKEATEATLVDLDGLANKASFDFGLTWAIWNPSADALALTNVCIDYLVKKQGKTAAEADELVKTNKFDCKMTNFPRGSSYRAKFASQVDWGVPKFVTARFKVGRQKFNFTTPGTFVDTSDTLNSYAVTGGAGVLTDTAGLLHASYQYQSDYELKTAEQICSPIADSTSTRCREISIGRPTRKIRNLLQFEVRKYFSDSFALNPKVTYDLRGEAWSVRLPLFLFQSKEGGLNGGISVGWRSDTKAFAISAFVGDVLGLMPK